MGFHTLHTSEEVRQMMEDENHNKWKGELLAEAEAMIAVTNENYNDPHQMLTDVINAHRDLALDPLFSHEALQLMKDACEGLALMFEGINDQFGNPISDQIRDAMK